MHAYADMHTYQYMYIHKHIHTQPYKCIHVHTYAYICMLMHTYAYMCIYAYAAAGPREPKYVAHPGGGQESWGLEHIYTHIYVYSFGS